MQEGRKFAKVCNINIVCVYGGTGISEQIAELKVWHGIPVLVPLFVCWGVGLVVG